MGSDLECYYCEHYYARYFEGNGPKPRTVRIDACRLASKTKRRNPGQGVADSCSDYQSVNEV